jgi:hypothetical protein
MVAGTKLELQGTFYSIIENARVPGSNWVPHDPVDQERGYMPSQ